MYDYIIQKWKYQHDNDCLDSESDNYAEILSHINIKNKKACKIRV